MIRVHLPSQLRRLAGCHATVELELAGAVTQRAVVEAIEARFPPLRGTIYDPATRYRRPLLRFYACQRDLSETDPDAPLPEPVQSGVEPLIVVAAIAGG